MQKTAQDQKCVTLKQSEAKIQQDCVMWFRNDFCIRSGRNGIIFHVPNQNQQRLVQIGVLAGVSDLMCCIEGKWYCFEIKDDTGKQTPAQIEFEKRVRELGTGYWIVRSLEQFKEIVWNL